jgi:predicted dienelactone hydrolase
MAETRWVRRILKGFAALAILGVLGITGLVGFLWTERRRVLTLPAATGSFAVGRSILDWKDAAALDTLAPVPGTKRELLVWIWYPAASGPSAKTEDYLPAELRLKSDGASPTGLWGWLTRDVTKVRVHSTRDVGISPQERSYPVVIMRAGASAGVLNYSALAEDLASHGYVVVGFDAPYRTGRVVFPDGRMLFRTEENNPERCVVPERVQMEHCANRVLSAWTGDIRFVLDRLARLNAADSSGRFTGRLDLSRVGAFGHSFGGAAVAQFCHDDPRCKAGVDLDGAPHGSVIEEGIQQPFMFLLSDHGAESDAASRQIEADIQSMYDRLPPDGRLRATIRGAFHFTFSDDGALLKSSVLRGVLRMTGRLGIDARRQLAITSYCLHSFFDAYLKGTGRSQLKIPAALFPEIQVQ